MTGSERILPRRTPLEDPLLSVVMPVYNEEENLPALDRELRRELVAVGRRCEIVFVDDCSTDGSPQVLRALVAAAQGGPIRTRVLGHRSPPSIVVYLQYSRPS